MPCPPQSDCPDCRNYSYIGDVMQVEADRLRKEITGHLEKEAMLRFEVASLMKIVGEFQLGRLPRQ